MTRAIALEALDASTLTSHLRRRSTLVLFSLGIAAALIHAATRFPLHLPGHQGIEWMALLMLARMASRYRWAATVAAAGAAAVAPFLGFHDPLTSVAYLLPGVILDLAAFVSAGNLVVMVAGAALGYTAHPVLDWLLLQATGTQFGPAQAAFAAHLMFGLLGALLGAGLWRFARR